jgi:hypothetical protein
LDLNKLWQNVVNNKLDFSVFFCCFVNLQYIFWITLTNTHIINVKI